MNPGFLIGLIAVTATVCVWGIQLPVAKDAFAILDPYHMTSIRYALASVLMIVILLIREGQGAVRYDDHAFSASALGVLGMCGSPLLVFLGMALSRAEHAAVIVALQPSIAAIALWSLRGVRPQNFTLACIATAFFGVVLVVTKGEVLFVETQRELFGDILVFFGAACWVAYTIGTSRLAGWSIWRITVLTLLPGAIATALVTETLVLMDHLEHPTQEQLFNVRWELSYLTFIGVLFALLAWNFGNRRIGPQNSTLLINLLPVSTFTYRASQGHRFESIELVGCGLVVAALVTNNLYLRAHQLRADKELPEKA